MVRDGAPPLGAHLIGLHTWSPSFQSLTTSAHMHPRYRICALGTQHVGTGRACPSGAVISTSHSPVPLLPVGICLKEPRECWRGRWVAWGRWWQPQGSEYPTFVAHSLGSSFQHPIPDNGVAEDIMCISTLLFNAVPMCSLNSDGLKVPLLHDFTNTWLSHNF